MTVELSGGISTGPEVFFEVPIYIGEGRALEITVNGQPTEVEPDLTIAGLIGQMGIQPRYVAVERNRELVPRATHAECTLQPGDELEVVTLVGGG